uniref:Uncharacterized protein n=1 Tax=Rousettus aegyptiacus TaxID=9407 RepID=A0A7J8EKB3_ROUAE|nr:hypothetical protein HJG63_012513 [Rousettus aegyptiacus]
MLYTSVLNLYCVVIVMNMKKTYICVCIYIYIYIIFHFLLPVPYFLPPLRILIFESSLFSHCYLNLFLCMLNVHSYIAIRILFLLFKLIMPRSSYGLHSSASICLIVTLLQIMYFLLLFYFR